MGGSTCDRSLASNEIGERLPVHAGERGQFDDIHPALPGLALRDERLRDLEAGSHCDLRQPRALAGGTHEQESPVRPMLFFRPC